MANLVGPSADIRPEYVVLTAQRSGHCVRRITVVFRRHPYVARTR